jgi:hypothetical protein
MKPNFSLFRIKFWLGIKGFYFLKKQTLFSVYIIFEITKFQFPYSTKNKSSLPVKIFLIIFFLFFSTNFIGQAQTS